MTDQECRKAWSVQVKTNAKAGRSWLVGPHATSLKSDSHVYVFVNLMGEKRPEYLVALSAHVASKVRIFLRKNSVWYAFFQEDRPLEDEGWSLFGDPHAEAEPEDTTEENSS